MDIVISLIIGVSVVFVGLLVLICLVKLMSFFICRFTGLHKNVQDCFANETSKASLANDTELETPVFSLSPEQRRELVACISASIGEYLGKDISGIRIHSIRRVGERRADTSLDTMPIDKRRELMAVISTAIAYSLGTDTSQIRIHSVRCVGNDNGYSVDVTEHRQFIAAVSAAVATEMGENIDSIRIRKIKRIA